MWPNFSLFHVNIRSLSKHFDELHSLLYSSKIPFDVIGVTETKQLVNKDFLTNVNIEDYQLHTQPTRSSCGGVAMYIKKALDHKILQDLTLFRLEGGGHIVPPYRFFPCCAETACSTPMKLSEF